MQPMRRPSVLRLFGALWLGSAMTVTSSAQAPPSGATFHTGTAVVSLNVTVRDQARGFV